MAILCTIAVETDWHWFGLVCVQRVGYGVELAGQSQPESCAQWLCVRVEAEAEQEEREEREEVLQELEQSFPCSPRRRACQSRLMCPEGSSSPPFARVGAGEKC